MMFRFVVLYRIEGDDEAQEWERVATHAEAQAIADRVIGTDKHTGGIVVTAAWVVDLED